MTWRKGGRGVGGGGGGAVATDRSMEIGMVWYGKVGHFSFLLGKEAGRWVGTR